jgi:tRNA nucleotidyltransferase (CCA-adding enzyme)
MHLILTHEQTDFDGFASLVACRLLNPHALAVLPRRLNRNVKAYLTLYGEGLPLVEHDDLPQEDVEQVTLVDTQPPVSVKGMTPETGINVIDHHPPGEGLDPSWTTRIEEVGATTTLLVEALREAGVELTVVVATLLLLGIHEDTGSLTYPATRARDVRACAWLLERGVKLAVAEDFLNHPLSADQRSLFHNLLESAETLEFHGLSIVLACGAAGGMVDEISTIAHKLRDLFDPDGLVVLVSLDGVVQMVARSTTEAVDVGQVAGHFGGGGHSRAAAALIRDTSVSEVREQVIELLPQIVKPALTVGEIMSRGPQLLSPEQSIKEAAVRMQRFGHEGYPVVKDSAVVGLLTRRAVDRAMNHGLGDRPIESIMEPGDLVVHPSDSVQLLQRVMVEHGWGQIPVADPEEGDIIGIVTRTDLLKTMATSDEDRTAAELTDRLERALPPERMALLKRVAQQAEARGDALYVVGGFVRDLLLGTPSVDFDLVVEGDAIGLAHSLADRCGGRVSSHRRFGTAKWRLDPSEDELLDALGVGSSQAESLPETLDFVSARTEFYPHPTALPSVERGSIKLDLHRRDFTINTLALRLDGAHYGQLLDPWGGGRDLREQVIRVLHSLSFVDDPTRMLRAVRLEQRLDFLLEERTLELLLSARGLLSRVSGERLRSELDLIFKEARVLDIMARLYELDLLNAIHRSLTWDDWLAARFEQVRSFQSPPGWKLEAEVSETFLFYAMLCYRLSPQELESLAGTLSIPGRELEHIRAANVFGRELPDPVEDLSPSEAVEILQEKSEETLIAIWLAAVDQDRVRELIDDYLRTWRHVGTIADGDTLREMDLPPGPAYRQILWRLRAARLDGEISTEKQERALLERLVEKVEQDG